MAKLNLDYYKGKDLYSDGDVEEEILEIARSGKKLEELEAVKFPVLYHLSRARENILNWYPFREGANVLEIGSGCGAITGLLCRRLGRVVSVELSRRRAGINYARHKDYENLEILVGNLNDIAFKETFDYVIFNGVFEYAMSFTPGEKPYETYLRSVSRLLKPDGKILVAIENRLGLKYFAGAPEDHTDGYFDGIREYEGNDTVRTFSKAEWETLMHSCGLEYYKFYYPYPDYKFPREIFTDASLKDQKYGCPTWNFTKYRMALFSEEKMASALQQEGVMDRFANSFLIEMSAAPFTSSVEYVKLSTDRADRFCAATVICKDGNGKYVVKMPMEEAASSHIGTLAAHTQQYRLWEPLPGRLEKDGIVYPFLPGKSLGHQAEEAVQNGDFEELRRLLAIVRRLCEDEGLRHADVSEMTQKETEAFGQVFGETMEEDLWRGVPCVAPANIDLILDNIFLAEDGRYRVIDCEWMFDFPVPSAFLLWRAVNELYSTYPFLDAQYAKKDLLSEFGITREQDESFQRWAVYFTEHYVGANRLLAQSVPEIGVSLEEFRTRLLRSEYLECQLFVDTGNGFSEQEKLCAQVPLEEGGFTVTFDLRSFGAVRGLRFDPVEGSACICRIDPAKTTARLSAANASAHTQQGDVFLTPDPIYHVQADKGAQQITVSAGIRLMTEAEALTCAQQLLQKAKKPLGFLRKH